MAGSRKGSALSGGDDIRQLVVLPPALAAVVGALRSLQAPDLPALAVVGGMAVNIRLSTADDAHRATRDVDVVADDVEPGAIEVLARDHPSPREHTVVVDGIEVDVIPTVAVTGKDLEGLNDDQRLFVAGHRWALETAQLVDIRLAGSSDGVSVPVAMPAGLVAAKSHAAGYPRATRRATKHAGDLYDVFRLVEVFDRQGDLASQLVAAPGELARLVADVIEKEILANPARAARQMGDATTSGPPSVERVRDVLEPFVDTLHRR